MAAEQTEALGVPGKVQPDLRLVASPERLYRCTCCGRDGIPESDMAPTRIRKDGTRGYSWCRPCKRESVRIAYVKVKADPERNARRRRLEREAKARKRATDPETAERMRRQSRETAARVQVDEERRVARNARKRAARARLKASDPEGYERLKQREREWYRLRMLDPAARAKCRETQRFHARLQRERNGAQARGHRVPLTVLSEIGGRLPAEPLRAFVDGLIVARRIELDEADREQPSMPVTAIVCGELGITERDLRRWRSEAKSVLFDVADRVVQRSGRLWWEVFDAERWPEAHEKARRLFEGD